MMVDVIEVVFDNVPRAKLYGLLSYLVTSSSEILDVQSSVEFNVDLDGKLNQLDFAKFQNIPEDAYLHVKVNEMRIDKSCLSNVFIRVIKYGDLFDVEYSFNEEYLTGEASGPSVEDLQTHTSSLGTRFGAGEWYCGMEPAIDKGTRYFTKSEKGPLEFR